MLMSGTLTLSPEQQSVRMSKIASQMRLNLVWHRMLYRYGNSGRQRVKHC